MLVLKRFSLFFVGLAALTFILIPAHTHAVEVLNNEQVCNNASAKESAVCKESGETGNPIFGPDGVITFVINILSVIIGVAAVIVIILAGLKFITSGDNPQEVSKAREMIIYAAVGLVIAALSQVLVRFAIAIF